jgi:uncharacterized membrane protein HdeD (DUF308 family)
VHLVVLDVEQVAGRIRTCRSRDETRALDSAPRAAAALATPPRARCRGSLESKTPALNHDRHAPSAHHLNGRATEHVALGVVLLGGLREAVAQYWWVPLTRGTATVLFGLLTLAWPNATVGALAVTFGLFCLVDSFIALIGDFDGEFWPSVYGGVASLVAAVIALQHAEMTINTFRQVVCGWALAKGLFDVVAAARLHTLRDLEAPMALAAIGSLGFAALLWLDPTIEPRLVVWLLGFYATTLGVVGVTIGLGMRDLK